MTTTAQNSTKAAVAVAGFQGNPSIAVGYDGDYTSTVFGVLVDKATVKKMLPPGVDMMQKYETADGRYPIYYLHNQFSKMEAPGITPFQYNEFLTYIPALQTNAKLQCQVPASADGKQAAVNVTLGAVAFMPNLSLNLQTPVDIGVKYYGMNKSLATVTASNTTWQVGPVSGPINYSATFGAERALSAAGTTRVKALLDSMPNALLGNTGATVWSGFEPDFKNAKITSIDSAKIDAVDSLLIDHHLEVKGINSEALGAYRVRTTFKGSVPAPCKIEK